MRRDRATLRSCVSNTVASKMKAVLQFSTRNITKREKRQNRYNRTLYHSFLTPHHMSKNNRRWMRKEFDKFLELQIVMKIIGAHLHSSHEKRLFFKDRNYCSHSSECWCLTRRKSKSSLTIISAHNERKQPFPELNLLLITRQRNPSFTKYNAHNITSKLSLSAISSLWLWLALNFGKLKRN